MGDEEKPEAPVMQQAPPPPSAADLMNQAIAAQGTAFDAAMPRLGQYGQGVQDVQASILPQINKLNLQQKQVYGPALVSLAIDMAKQADPSGFTLRQTLVDKAREGLAAGGGFSDQERQLLQNDIRQAQANRGFGTGQSDILDEAGFMASQRFGREQARLGNALSVLAGNNPGNMFMNQANQVQMAGMPNVEGMAGNLIPSTGTLMGVGQNSYAQQAANINNANQMAQHQAEWQTANTRNPLQEDIMFGLQVGQGLSNMAGSAMGGMMGTSSIGGMAGGLMGGMGGGGMMARPQTLNFGNYGY